MNIYIIKKNIHILLWGVFFLALYLIFGNNKTQEDGEKENTVKASVQKKDESPCSPENTRKRMQYFYKYIERGYFHLAADFMKDCFLVNIDADVKKEIGEAIAQSYVKTIGDEAGDALERKYAAIELGKLSPVLYEQNKPQIDLIIKRADEIEARNALAQEKKDKEAARKLGVYIGMSRAQVEGSNWGYPDKKQVITHARGSTEIWFYGIGQSLMFEGDKLVQIMQ